MAAATVEVRAAAAETAAAVMRVAVADVAARDKGGGCELSRCEGVVVMAVEVEVAAAMATAMAAVMMAVEMMAGREGREGLMSKGGCPRSPPGGG